MAVHNVGYGLIWSPPVSPPAEVAGEAVEVEVAEPVALTAVPTAETADKHEMITNVDGGLTLLGRWLIRFWLRISVRRT
jgi:hypothetical protein